MSGDKVRSYGPGKFDTLLDSYVYACALDTSWLHEQESDENGGGWAGLVIGPGSEIADAVQEIAEENGDTLNAAELAHLRAHDALIIEENSWGSVSVQYFELKTQAHRAWRDVAADFDKPCDCGDCDDCNDA